MFFFEYESWCFWGFNGDIYIVYQVSNFFGLSQNGAGNPMSGDFVVSGETDPPWLWLRDPETWWYGFRFFRDFPQIWFVGNGSVPKKIVWSTSCKVGYGGRPRWIIGHWIHWSWLHSQIYIADSWMLWRLVNPWHGQVGATMAPWHHEHWGTPSASADVADEVQPRIFKTSEKNQNT